MDNNMKHAVKLVVAAAKVIIYIDSFWNEHKDEFKKLFIPVTEEFKILFKLK